MSAPMPPDASRQTLVRVSAEVASIGAARGLVTRLEQLADPPPLATTLFESPATGGWRVDAYFDAAPDPGYLALIAAEPDLPAPTLTFEPVPDENWVVISQAALPPVAAGRFVVHGSHDRARIGFRLNAIEIDAGEAFGTAHHATTQGCLEALDRIARRRPGGRTRILDLGCGSGVLAIAAARALPNASVIASDIDGVAVAVARGNLARNRAAARVRAIIARGLDHPDLRAPARFDLVLANILAGPLIRLAPSLARAVRPGGTCVLSGILREQAAEVAAVYRASGFDLRERRIFAGWATLVLERRSTGLSPNPQARQARGVNRSRARMR